MSSNVHHARDSNKSSTPQTLSHGGQQKLRPFEPALRMSFHTYKHYVPLSPKCLPAQTDNSHTCDFRPACNVMF